MAHDLGGGFGRAGITKGRYKWQDTRYKTRSPHAAQRNAGKMLSGGAGPRIALRFIRATYFKADLQVICQRKVRSKHRLDVTVIVEWWAVVEQINLLNAPSP